MPVCAVCLDEAVECIACGGTLNGPPARSSAFARGAHRARERANQYGLAREWPPPYEGATRQAALKAVADLGGDEACRERRARYLWESAREEWYRMQRDRIGPFPIAGSDGDCPL